MEFQKALLFIIIKFVDYGSSFTREDRENK